MANTFTPWCVAFGSVALLACSGASGGGGTDWDCANRRVPLGRTIECVSSTSEGLSYDGTSNNGGGGSTQAQGGAGTADGPAYYCSDNMDGADCPSASAWAGQSTATADGTADDSFGAAAGYATQVGFTNGSPLAGGALGRTATQDGTGNTVGGGTTSGGKDGKGGTGTGTGTGAGTGTGTGTGAGAGDGLAGSGAGSPSGFDTGTWDGTTGGFFCTRENGLRICRRAPICDAGAHRVQMDCEPDASITIPGGPSTGSGYPGAGAGPGSASTSDGAMTGGQTECFYAPGTGPGTSMPAATYQYILETFAGVQHLHMRLTFTPEFVDNSYGTTSIGWTSHQHQFRELVGSDHAELSFSDKTAVEKLHFKLDYISATTSAPSGYASLGVTGGEGRMILGNASSVTRVVTSLDRNLNERGYASYTVNSPPTDASYSPSSAAPAWDYRVVYEAWIKNDAFGAAGYGSVKLTFVHASPSKAGTNTLPVASQPCPPDWMTPR